MFFRTKTVKNTSLLQLVESYRNAEGQPRQRVAVSLGDARLPETEKNLIARAVENHLNGQADLLCADLSEEAAAWVRRILQLAGRSKSARPVCSESIDGVLVDRVETENVVQLGPQLVAKDPQGFMRLPAPPQETLGSAANSAGGISSTREIKVQLKYRLYLALLQQLPKLSGRQAGPSSRCFPS